MHDILGARFYSFRTEPWHHLGTIGNNESMAVEVLTQIHGDLNIKVLPLHTEDDWHLPDHLAIIREPLHDDPFRKVFGIVKPGYKLVTPLQIAELCDQYVNKPVETMGVLGQGETFFISYKMRAISVQGDPVDAFCLVDVDITGKPSHVRFVIVRVVCRNTLVAARDSQLETFSIDHYQNTHGQFQQVLDGVIERQEEKVKAVEAVMNQLATPVIERKEVEQIIQAAYPFPKKPPSYADQLEFDDYNERMETLSLYQHTALQLFNGAGTGMDIPNTPWKAFNAVTELVDWGGGEVKAETLYRRSIGSRVKERAWSKAVEVAGA